MKFLYVCLLIVSVVHAANNVFSLYPLANDYFDIIYQIKADTDAKSHNLVHQDKLYLRVFCKQHNVVSVSLSQQLAFRQQPRFPVFSQQAKQIPKFQEEIYTFLSACNIEVKVNQSPGSIISIIRRQNNQSIFELKDLNLKLGHNSFTVVDKSIKWGLGERFQKNFKVTDGFWTIYNRDKPWIIDTGKHGRSQQTYGHQPLYLARQEIDGFTHISYFKNTHGMLIQSKSGSNELTYNSIGGNIHFVLFVGDKDPQALLQRYHSFIGGIHIPPFWSLGWHQCRWGYKNLETFKSVIQGYDNNKIPIDTMWNDLDYMNKKAIFTIDQSVYPPEKLSSLLKEKSLHWIPLIDVGVSLKDKDSINLGTQTDVFLRDIHNPSQYYIGQVWPGKVHFVDYLHPNASFFWQHQLNRLYQKVPFSGVWLDMNEPSNFKGNQPISQIYRIQQSETINMMTLDNQLKHFNVHNRSEPFEHRQIHSYYGHMSVVPTYEFLKKHARPFIISRSNSVSTGAYAGHWTGDNVADWDFLRLSISGNFLFQIFGIQMVGADICGFHHDTTQQLCSRWTQLGSLYPFARNHNEDVAKSQQPFVLGEKVLKTAQSSINQRYSLLKQLYSILVDLKGKRSFFRPIYFEFFDDLKTLDQNFLETQFLLGKSLLSAPIVQKGKQQRNVYFPGKNDWHMLQYNMENPGQYKKQNIKKNINGNAKSLYLAGSTQKIKNKITTSPPLFLRGGHMIFSNEPKSRSKYLQNNFHLVASLNEQNLAINRFLTIQDYQNQNILGKCIESAECITQFQLQKTAQNSFSLKWKFQGQPTLFGRIYLKSVTVWQKEKQWISSQYVKIQQKEGKIILNLKQNI